MEYQPLSASEDTTEIECRNCHELGKVGEDLIAPCRCKGSVKYVHRTCLDTWRSVSHNPESFWKCDVCKFGYQMETRNEISKTASVRFALLVTRDITAIILGVNLIILFLGFLCSLVDPEQQVLSILPNIHLVPSDWSSGAHKFLIIYEFGGLLFFFIMGLFACCIGCNYLCQDERSRNAPTYYYYTYPYGNPYCGDYYFIYWGSWSCNTNNASASNMCSGCNGNCDCKDSSGGGLGIIAIIILVIVAIIVLMGIIFGIVCLIIVSSKIVRRHVTILNKRKNAVINFVKDMDGIDLEHGFVGVQPQVMIPPTVPLVNNTPTYEKKNNKTYEMV